MREGTAEGREGSFTLIVSSTMLLMRSHMAATAGALVASGSPRLHEALIFVKARSPPSERTQRELRERESVCVCVRVDHSGEGAR